MAVQRRSQPELDHLAQAGQARRQHHPPHGAVDVVQQDDAGASGPQRGEERHAVPDLDQTVGTAAATNETAQGATGKDAVPARLPDHVVSRPGGDRLLARRSRRAHRDVDADASPSRGDSMGMELGPSRLGVLEIPPGQHLHALQPDLEGLGGHGVEPGDGGEPLGQRPGRGLGHVETGNRRRRGQGPILVAKTFLGANRQNPKPTIDLGQPIPPQVDDNSGCAAGAPRARSARVMPLLRRLYEGLGPLLIVTSDEFTSRAPPRLAPVSPREPRLPASFTGPGPRPGGWRTGSGRCTTDGRGAGRDAGRRDRARR